MKKSVEIELDKIRHLRFTINSLIEAEELIGKPIQKIGENIGLRELRILLWAGLKHEDRTLTLQRAGDLMELKDLNYIAMKVVEALALAFPQTEGSGETGEAPTM